MTSLSLLAGRTVPYKQKRLIQECWIILPYSPAAIIRNAKIWNIILLLAFFRTLSSNLDLEYPAVSEENC